MQEIHLHLRKNYISGRNADGINASSHPILPSPASKAPPLSTQELFLNSFHFLALSWECRILS